MTKAQVVTSITFATAYHAGMDALYVVEDAVGDLLDAEWEPSRAAD
jgi:hypothetical protein